MNYFYEPVNLLQWNMFQRVKNIGHIETFLATSAMHSGDIVLLHIGQQVPQYPSGIYAVGTVITEPYILQDSPEQYCNNKKSVDVKITKINYLNPYIVHEACARFIHQFRTVHKIDPKYYTDIERILEMDH